jgi:hypothetical protein
MNSDLYGEQVQLPEQIIVYLKQCSEAVPDANDKIEGYKRNKELRDSGFVTYQQLKRMKNFFDNYTGDKTDMPFILNGADYVKTWVDNTLTSMRDNAYLSKKIKSTVLPNQFIDPHQKNQNLSYDNRPSQKHKNTLGKYNLQVTENLKRINDLLKKII